MKVSVARLLVFLAAAISGAEVRAQVGATHDPSALEETKAPYSPHADRRHPTHVYFGETHVHSALSGDAGAGGTKLMPRDMYRFARGEQVMSNTGQPVNLGRPLDFMALTEHTDGMGVITDILNGAPNIMADPQGKQVSGCLWYCRLHLLRVGRISKSRPA